MSNSTELGSEDDAKLEALADEATSDRISGLVYWIALFYGAFGILVAMNQTFSWDVGGYVLVDNSYYYLLIAIFLPLSFLIFPARNADRYHVPIYDWVLAIICLVAAMYLSYYGGEMVEQGWDIVAPPVPTIAAAAICFLALEAVRRAGGNALFIIATMFFLFPLWTDVAPGFLWGFAKEPLELVRAHAMGFESIIGVPMRVAGNLLIGFLIFGSALVVTGGGDFFMNFASALMGRSRGGPAKVAILSSGFFGSLSGSVISNVVTTGKLTIPTMKRVGYPAVYAGAVESCASTGGALMPPVMGAVAFLMAEFLNVPYSTVMIAAVVPAVIFYIALLLQVDNYAAVNGLKGMDEADIPNLWETFKDGWYYIFSLVALVYMLVWLRLDLYAPYYAAGILIFCSIIFRKGDKRFNFAKFKELIVDSTKIISNIIAILAGVGMIVGSLAFTGVGGAFSRELLQIAGDNLYILLAMGAVTSFLLGMGMTVSACYIFLAIVLGPALIDAGLDPIASHLFILYWGMLSYITPPVALAAVAASIIAKADTMAIGMRSMRLGLINFILPFIFVLNPALILRGEWDDIIIMVSTALVAVWLMAAAFEGYLAKVGVVGWSIRIPLLVAAGCLLYPEGISKIAGVVLVAICYAIALFQRKSVTA
ncbi:MAG: TRAP transporter fused permease subunit [Rhodospirillaceae bacterium]|jgi:TRAP transporter 4TM/12TM fusion protein|nr:TRAP transporter fused permease subunit [Rhodospirillaceae bacterium]MBT3494143.1 TRAP transporter fused permease subunit [Rhodospirillaceae bacterium]MBT3779329.1 TRAP transporter fused permease subunit [Rhodospirillaceae bacterium]MBT3975372.1 TRAP transporter fused permease subunit [Rhodospirillaceae bacterium]MBT4167577.1 TRAP transporter fused permease subunit [Rhodospirillaceae bacterium]